MSFFCKIAALAICPVVCAFQVYGQNHDYTPLIEKYRKIFAEEMLQNHVAGMSIALVDGDKVVWAEGFGWYDSAAKKKVTPETPFHIGSVCKTFTGLAVMMLQEQHKLDINNPLHDYLPGFKLRSAYGRTDTISIRSILSHHAGIPDFAADKFLSKPRDYREVLQVVNRDWATQAPNTFFSYSNAGISLLGNVIEKVSGMDYYTFLRKNILDPMGMKGAGFVKGDGDPASVRLGYNLKGEERAEMPVWDAPAGCLYASAADMARFIQAHLGWGRMGGKKLFDSSSLAQMMQVQNAGVWADFGSPQGLIWKLYQTEGGWGIQHDGGTLYHRAELSMVPEAGLGVVILSNSSSGKPLQHADYDILNEAIRIKGRQLQQPWPPVVRNPVHKEHNFSYNGNTHTPAPVFTHLDSATLGHFAGDYGTFGALFHITADNNALKVKVASQTFYLLPSDHNEFIGAGAINQMMIKPDMRMYFDSIGTRIVLVQCDTWGNQNILGEKMPGDSIPAEWIKRIGAWNATGRESYQMFTDPVLSQQGNKLVLTCRMNIEIPGTENNEVNIPLDIRTDRIAVVPGFSRFCGQVVEVEKQEDGKEVLNFLGFAMKRRY